MANKTFFYAKGKRKNSIARARVYNQGEGNITVNDRDIKAYFFGTYVSNVLAPLKLTETHKKFDINILVSGGGYSSQSDACRHAIAKALLEYDPLVRLVLKHAGYLTRDSRIKERKKPGLKRARRAPQWAKR
jgi:small subunit ribosomal protein S9